MLQNELRIVMVLGIHTSSSLMMGEHFQKALLATLTSIVCYGMILATIWVSQKVTDQKNQNEEPQT